MDKLVACVYKEKRIYTIDTEQLWVYKCELSKLNYKLNDLDSYYFIDKKKRFWIAENLLVKLFSKEDLEEMEFESKYVDIIDNKQIKLYLVDFETNEKNEYFELFKIILLNKRIGFPRENYLANDGSVIKIFLPKNEDYQLNFKFMKNN